MSVISSSSRRSGSTQSTRLGSFAASSAGSQILGEDPEDGRPFASDCGSLLPNFCGENNRGLYVADMPNQLFKWCHANRINKDMKTLWHTDERSDYANLGVHPSMRDRRMLEIRPTPSKFLQWYCDKITGGFHLKKDQRFTIASKGGMDTGAQAYEYGISLEPVFPLFFECRFLVQLSRLIKFPECRFGQDVSAAIFAVVMDFYNGFSYLNGPDGHLMSREFVESDILQIHIASFPDFKPREETAKEKEARYKMFKLYDVEFGKMDLIKSTLCDKHGTYAFAEYIDGNGAFLPPDSVVAWKQEGVNSLADLAGRIDLDDLDHQDDCLVECGMRFCLPGLIVRSETAQQIRAMVVDKLSDKNRGRTSYTDCMPPQRWCDVVQRNCYTGTQPLPLVGSRFSELCRHCKNDINMRKICMCGGAGKIISNEAYEYFETRAGSRGDRNWEVTENLWSSKENQIRYTTPCVGATVKKLEHFRSQAPTPLPDRTTPNFVPCIVVPYGHKFKKAELECTPEGVPITKGSDMSHWRAFRNAKISVIRALQQMPSGTNKKKSPLGRFVLPGMPSHTSFQRYLRSIRKVDGGLTESHEPLWPKVKLFYAEKKIASDFLSKKAGKGKQSIDVAKKNNCWVCYIYGPGSGACHNSISVGERTVNIAPHTDTYAEIHLIMTEPMTVHVYCSSPMCILKESKCKKERVLSFQTYGFTQALEQMINEPKRTTVIVNDDVVGITNKLGALADEHDFTDLRNAVQNRSGSRSNQGDGFGPFEFDLEKEKIGLYIPPPRPDMIIPSRPQQQPRRRQGQRAPTQMEDDDAGEEEEDEEEEAGGMDVDDEEEEEGEEDDDDDEEDERSVRKEDADLISVGSFTRKIVHGRAQARAPPRVPATPKSTTSARTASSRGTQKSTTSSRFQQVIAMPTAAEIQSLKEKQNREKKQRRMDEFTGNHPLQLPSPQPQHAERQRMDVDSQSLRSAASSSASSTTRLVQTKLVLRPIMQTNQSVVSTPGSQPRVGSLSHAGSQASRRESASGRE